MHEALLARVDAADADLADPLRADRRHAGRRSRSAPAGRGRTGRRPACRGCCRSGVSALVLKSACASSHSMRSFLPALAAVARHRADRADAQAVVAAEQDRQPAQRPARRARRRARPVPGDHLGAGGGSPRPAAARGWPGRSRLPRSITSRPWPSSAGPMLATRSASGPMLRAAGAGADVGRRADQGYRWKFTHSGFSKILAGRSADFRCARLA